MKILKQYIPTGARHKLLFTSHHAEGMNFVDIGALLARSIESSLSNRHLSFVAEEELEKIFKANVCHSSEIGDYIAIRNIGILFGPAIVTVGDHIQESLLQEDEVLLQYYDVASMRV